MQLVLIRIETVSAVANHFVPDDGRPLTTRELRKLARITKHIINTSSLLVSYAIALGGTPRMN